MKNIIRILSLGVFVSALALGSCVSDTVATRPEDPVVVVPASPGPTYVWVDGSWHYNRPTQAYVFQHKLMFIVKDTGLCLPVQEEPGLQATGYKPAEAGDM